MRVLSVLSLLCLCVLGVSGQYTLDASSLYNMGWILTGITGYNPTLNFTAGNTYNFTVSAGVGASHPFAFSSLKNADSTLITPVDATNYTVTSNGCGGTGSNNDGYKNAGCVISIAIAANAPNATIFYKCTAHLAMTGQINIWAAAPAANTTGNTTTVAPTTAAPTTAAPTNNTGNATTVAPTTAAPSTAAPTTSAPTTGPVTGGTIVSNSFHITGNSLASGYIFTHGGVQYLNPTLNVTANQSVTISFEWGSSRNHPFGLSLNSNNSLDAATLQSATTFPTYITNQITLTTPSTCNTSYFSTFTTYSQNATDFCVIQVAATVIQLGLPPVYYRCARHPLMIGTINIVAAAAPASSTGGSSTGGSSSGGSSSGSNTPKPSSSSTGGNSASTITLSGLTMVFAIIVAMLA